MQNVNKKMKTNVLIDVTAIMHEINVRFHSIKAQSNDLIVIDYNNALNKLITLNNSFSCELY